MDFTNEESIRQAADDLWHDEHIQAAQEAGIVGDAFIVSFGSAPNSSDQRSPRLHYLSGTCHSGCYKMPHDNSCRIRFSDLVIDDQHLVPLFRSIPIAAGLLEGRAPLILDIVLDYFLTEQAFRPHKHTLLSSLAQRAEIITIATEPIYVEDSRIDAEITWERSLARVLDILGATGKDPASCCFEATDPGLPMVPSMPLRTQARSLSRPGDPPYRDSRSSDHETDGPPELQIALPVGLTGGRCAP